MPHTKIINTHFWKAVTVSINSIYSLALTFHKYKVERQWMHGHFQGGYWYDGIWEEGFWQTRERDNGIYNAYNYDYYGGVWLNGTWIKGNMLNKTTSNYSIVSPKSYFKPKSTIALNYAKYT